VGCGKPGAVIAKLVPYILDFIGETNGPEVIVNSPGVKKAISTN
jgi:hypothetical protein